MCYGVCGAAWALGLTTPGYAVEMLSVGGLGLCLPELVYQQAAKGGQPMTKSCMGCRRYLPAIFV